MSQSIIGMSTAVQADANSGQTDVALGQTGASAALSEVSDTSLATGTATRDAVVSRAVALAREVKDNTTRALTWARLIPLLEGEARSDAIGSALVAAAAGQSGWAIKEIEIYLGSDRRQLALQIAYLLPGPAERLVAISSFINRAHESERDKLIIDCIEIARNIPERWRPEAIGGLAPHLDEATLTDLLSLNQIMECLDTWPGLGKRLSEPLRERLLAEIELRPSVKSRTPALAHLLPFLAPERSDEIVSKCLDELRLIDDKLAQAAAIADLLPFVPREIWDSTLYWGLASASLGEPLNGPGRDGGPWDAAARSRALVRFARYLPEALRFLVVSAVSLVDDENEKATALQAIAPWLVTERLLGDAVIIAEKLRAPAPYARAISAIALWMPRHQAELRDTAVAPDPTKAEEAVEVEQPEEPHSKSVSAMVLERYNQATIQLAEIYQDLTFMQALSVSPRLPFVMVSGALGAVAARSLDLGRIALLPSAWADERTFVPPLGLPQGVFTPMVVALFVFLLAGLCGAAYAGFVRKPKDQKAASAVLHLLSFFSGTFLGSKV